MTGGEIAGLIAAGVFAILVALLAVPIIKLGRVFDELRIWIRDLNHETEPLISEVVRTVATTNSQLDKVDGITDNVSDASANVSAMTSLVASTVGQPIIKVAAFSSGVRRALSPQAVRARRQQEQQMRTVPADDDHRSAPPSSDSDAFSTVSATEDAEKRPWWEGTEFDTSPTPDTVTQQQEADVVEADFDLAVGQDTSIVDTSGLASTDGAVPRVSSGGGRHAASPAQHDFSGSENVRGQ